MPQLFNVKLNLKMCASLIGALLYFLWFSQTLLAESSSVLLKPSRILFEGKTRTATVKIINPNKVATKYKISLISIRMNSEGNKYEVEVPSKEDIFARDLIRFSPRRATIEPNTWQTVRLMVRKPKNLAPGEYRSQLKVIPIPNPTIDSKDNKKESKGISVKINMVFSISIPVIVRHGVAEVQVIPNPPIIVSEKDKYYLETRLDRKGLFSAFCDVTAFFIPAGQKTKRIEIGRREAISIYTDNDYQIVQIPLENKKIITQGQIEIDISNREEKNAPLFSSKSFDYMGN